MREYSRSRISNVFIEIIILILFFSIAAVIIFKVYSVTISNSNESKIKNNAIISSNSIIALYKSGMDIEKCIKEGMQEKVKVNKYDDRYVVSMNMDLKYDVDGVVTLVATEETVKDEVGKTRKIKLKYLYYDEDIYNVEGMIYEEK